LSVVIAVRLEEHVIVSSASIKRVKELIAEEQFKDAALMLREMLRNKNITSSSEELRKLFFKHKKQTSFAIWMLEGRLNEQRS
jgi:hypothetical protein